MNWQGFSNVDTNPWSKLAEETGTWGLPALRTYMQHLRSEGDGSPAGTLRESPTSYRGRAVTFMPTEATE